MADRVRRTRRLIDEDDDAAMRACTSSNCIGLLNAILLSEKMSVADVCRRGSRVVRRKGKDPFRPVRQVASDLYALDEIQIAIGHPIPGATGAFGAIHSATFGGSRCVVKINKTNATRPAEELIVMLELFCAFRMEAWKHAREIHRYYGTETGMAHVPRLLFGVRLPNKSTTYGMQRIDVSFGTYMKRILGLGGKGIESKAWRMMKLILIRVAAFLSWAQGEFEFMHGDLHVDNVMLTINKTNGGVERVFLIDFGMSSMIVNGKRISAASRYDNMKFQKNLDLLMLLTSTTEAMARIGAPVCSLWCWQFIAGFWNPLLDALANDGIDLPSHGKVLPSARQRNLLTTFWAIFLLYEKAEGVLYSRTVPDMFLMSALGNRANIPTNTQRFKKSGHILHFHGDTDGL